MIDNYRKPLQSDWPTCPGCGSTLLVAGGVNAACLSCTFIGPVESIADALVSKIARTRIAMKPYGNRPVLFFHHDKEPKLDTETKMVLWEKSSMLTRRGIHNQVLFKIQEHINSCRTFTPMVVMNYYAEDLRFVTLPINNVSSMTKARFHAGTHDVSSVFWISTTKDVPEFMPGNSFTREIPDSGYLMMNTHFYGAESLVSASEFSRKSDGRLVFKHREFINHPVESWARQPVRWSIISGMGASVQPRWLSIREAPGMVNVNACVCENLDGGTICRISIHDLSIPNSLPATSDIPCQSCEEGIEKIKAKIEGMDITFTSGHINLSISFDCEWGIEENRDKIMMDIKSAPFWEQYSEDR